MTIDKTPDLYPEPGTGFVADADWNEGLRHVLDAPGEAARWAGTNPAKQALVRDLVELTAAIRDDSQTFSPALRARLRDVLDSNDASNGILVTRRPPTPGAVPRKFPPHRTAGWQGWALGAVMLAMVGSGGIFAVRHMNQDSSRDDLPVKRYATARSQSSVVELPDGSSVTLAPETELAYSESQDGARYVSLKGEAMFVIEHDPLHPFTVETERVVTKVLGTTFSVRKYDNDKYIRVAVESGRVASHGTSESVILTSGLVGYVTDSSARIVDSEKTDTHMAWTRGQLVFDDTPVPEMLATLKRWYGYEFRITDSTLANRYVTAVFNINAPAKTFRELQALLNVSMTFSDSVITLHPAQRRMGEHNPLRRSNTLTAAMEKGR